MQGRRDPAHTHSGRRLLRRAVTLEGRKSCLYSIERVLSVEMSSRDRILR